MMRPSTFFFLTRRGVRNLGKHWAMTIACIASLSVCMTLNIFASLAEVNVGSMVAYLGSQNETVVYLDPACDDATAAQVGATLSAMPGVSGVQYVSKQDVLDTYRGYMQDYSSLWDEFETDNPFKANYRVTLSDLTQMERMSVKMQAIPGVVSVTAPVEMTNVFVEIQKAVTKGGRMIVLVLMVVSIITVVINKNRIPIIVRLLEFSVKTLNALSKITDTGLFERLATAVLRESNPLYESLIHTGTNTSGQTVKSPIDGITFVSGANPPHMICVHHTTGYRDKLEKKLENMSKEDLIKLIKSKDIFY